MERIIKGIYKIGIYINSQEIRDNHGNLVYTVYYVYSTDGKLNFYKPTTKNKYELTTLLKESHLILYKTDVNHPLEIKQFFIITKEHIFHDIPDGDVKLIENPYCTTTTKEYVNKMKKNDFAIFCHAGSKIGYYEDVEIKDFRLYIKTRKLNLSSSKFEYIYEENEYDCFYQSEKQLITLMCEIRSLAERNTLLVNISPFDEEKFLDEVHCKYEEIKKYVDGIDINDICDRYKLSCKFHYITKIGGDDRLEVNIVSSGDYLTDIYISKLIPAYNSCIWEDSGYCNLYSCCDIKGLKEKVALLEKEHKEILKKEYDKKVHISTLLYEFVHDKFDKAASVKFTRLDNEILIQKYWNWIYQNCSLKDPPSYLKYKAESKRGFSSVLEDFNLGKD